MEEINVIGLTKTPLNSMDSESNANAMNKKQAKRVIVVLSSGRAGTSLLMKVLGDMGMQMSENLIPGSVGNPEGFFEDAEIVEEHKRLIADLGTEPTLPLPEGWLEAEATKKARPRLRKILENRLTNSNLIWGFKDPRTVAFLPLWNRILNVPGTVPVFILAVRDPAAVAVSLNRQINRENIITELQWLQRTTDALQHTAADCFIVHYEDWYSRPEELAQSLLMHTGLDQYFKGSVDAAIKDVIKPNLNRAVYEDYQVQNEYVLKLYDVLKDCRGDEFDRKRLMEVVKECRNAMDGFKGWYMEAHKCIGQQAETRGRLVKERERIEALKANLAKEQEIKKNELDQLTYSKETMIKEKEKELKEKQDQLTRAQVEADNLRKELDRVSTLAQEKEKALSENQAQAKSLNDEVNQVRKRAEEQIEKIENSYEKSLLKKDERIFEMENDLHAITLQNNEYLKQIKDLQEELQNQRLNFSAIENKLKQVAPKQHELESRVKELESEIAAKKQEHEEQVKTLGENIQNAKVTAEARTKQALIEYEPVLRKKDERIFEMENDLHAITLQNNEYLKQIKDLHDELQERRISLSAAKKELEKTRQGNKNRIKQMQVSMQKSEREKLLLRNSYSFRIGQILVNTVAKPGFNTIIFPFLLIKLIVEPLFKRDRKKIKRK